MTKTVRTCGKLYLAGEYSVLTAGQGAILKNIPIYMTGKIHFSERYQLFSDMFDHTVDLTPDDEYSLIQDTVAVMNEFLQIRFISLRPFFLTITGKMEQDGKKFGLGSSGSVVVLTIRAITALYGLALSAEETFKLAAYVLLKRGDNGSMGDVACIAYEDLIYYQSFNRKKIAEQINELPLEKIVTQDWGYIIRTIHPQLPCDFLVGWTREPSISSVLINQVKAKISSSFLTQTQEEVLRLEKALFVGEKEIVKQSLEKVSCLLLQLSPAIYNEKLRALKRSSQGLDCVAKSSGAGGGDCGIALSFDSEASQILVERWQAAGIEVLYKERWDR